MPIESLMRRFRVKMSSVVCVVLLQSCATQVSPTPTSIGELTEMEHHPLNFAEMRALCASPERDEVLRELFSKWGKQSAAVDLTVLRLLIYAGGTSGCAFDSRMLQDVEMRLEEDPHLLRQVFWHWRWWAGRNTADVGGTEFAEPFLVAFVERMPSIHSTSQRVHDLLLLCSMLQKPQLFAGVTWESIDERWDSIVTELAVTAPYYRYHEDTGAYVLDESAMESEQEVGIRGQAWSPAPSELPLRQYE